MSHADQSKPRIYSGFKEFWSDKRYAPVPFRHPKARTRSFGANGSGESEEEELDDGGLEPNFFGSPLVDEGESGWRRRETRLKDRCFEHREKDLLHFVS